MAGIGSRKLRASTLVEVLIAMVIIMAVFVTGIAIYTNVTQSAVQNGRELGELRQIVKGKEE